MLCKLSFQRSSDVDGSSLGNTFTMEIAYLHCCLSMTVLLGFFFVWGVIYPCFSMSVNVCVCEWNALLFSSL